MKPSSLPSWLLLLPIAYHAALSASFGGNVFPTTYGDPPCDLSLGLFLLGWETIEIDHPFLLPVFEALLFKSFKWEFWKVLWVWNLASIALLVAGVYLLAGKLFGENVGVTAGLLAGFNWHLGWYGQQMLSDAMYAALYVLTLWSLLNFREKPKMQALTGLLASVTMWTKFSATVTLFPPILALLAFDFIKGKKAQALKSAAWLAMGALAGQAPFILVGLNALGNPYEYLMHRANMSTFDACRTVGAAVPGFLPDEFKCGPLFYASRLPYALGLIPSLLAVIGAVLAAREKNGKPLLLLLGFAYVVYSFFVFQLSERFMTHFTPLLLILAALAVSKTAKNKNHFLALLGVSIIFTANSLPLFAYDIENSSLSLPVFLHDRLQPRPDYESFSRFSAEVKEALEGSQAVEIDAGYGHNCLLSVAAMKRQGPSGYVLSDKELEAAKLASWNGYALYSKVSP